MMKLAEWLCTDEFFTKEEREERIKHFSISQEEVLIDDDVLYTTYTLQDNSKITLGDNGYVGGEW